VYQMRTKLIWIFPKRIKLEPLNIISPIMCAP
jgi:hypothetical protein